MPFDDECDPSGPTVPASSNERADAPFAPALFTLDEEGRFVRAGLRLARLVGARRQDLSGVRLAEFIDPYDDESFADRWFDLQAGADAMEMDTTIITRSGERRRVRLDLLEQDGGGYAGVLTPETGHKGKTVPDFDVSKTLMDTFGTMVMIADPQGTPLFSNAALRRHFGRPLGGVNTGFRLVHPESRAKTFGEWQEAIAAGLAFSCDMRMAAPDGEYRWFRFDARPHHDDRGTLRFWATTLTDVEEEIAARDALTESRRFINRLSECLPDVVFLFDLERGENVFCSEASREILGYTPDEIRAMGPALLPTILHPDDRDWILSEMARATADPEAPDQNATTEYRIVRKDGETAWINTRSLVFDRCEDGRPKVNLGIAQDITARKAAEAERDDHTRILEHALSGVGVLDAEGRYLYANAEYAEIAGRSGPDLVGRSWTESVHPDDVERMAGEYERMLWVGRVEVECRGLRLDGAVVHQHVVMIPKYETRGHDGQEFAGHYRFVRDVTERVRFQGQLEGQLAHISSMTAELEHRSTELQSANAILAKQAGSDGLTGLANHRVLQETLQTLNEDERPHSLLLLDVDHFKAYNDAFGHPAGDVILREVARVLTEMTVGDELAARYGGEEFAVVLPDVDLEGADVRAGMILARLAEVAWPHREITASIGCALWHPGRTRADLIEAADRALYISKRNGRNRVTAAA